MGVADEDVHQSNYGFEPVYAHTSAANSDMKTNDNDNDNNNNDDDDEISVAVMSVALMLQNKTDAIIWRGPRKNGLLCCVIGLLVVVCIEKFILFCEPCLFASM